MDELTQKLMQLGFSTNEIEILMYLLTTNQAKKADEIAEAADISLTRVYEALDILEKRQFIIVHQGRPRLYEIKDPSKSIPEFIRQERQEMEERFESTQRLGSQILDITEGIYQQHHTQIQPDELLQQFYTLDGAEKRTRELITRAESEILVFTHVFNWYNKMKEELIAASERGVEIKVLLQPEASYYINFEELEANGLSLRLIQDSGKTRGTLVDGKSIIFVIWVDDRTAEAKRVYRPQFSSNKGIIEVFTGYFNHLWEQTESIQKDTSQF